MADSEQTFVPRKRREVISALRLQLPESVADNVEAHIEHWHANRKAIEAELDRLRKLADAMARSIEGAFSSAAVGPDGGDIMEAMADALADYRRGTV